MKFNIKNVFNKKSLRKLEKATLVGVASLVLIVPMAMNNVKTASAKRYLSEAEVESIENKVNAESEPGWKAQDRKYRPILRGYHGDMDEAYYELDEYYDSLKYSPWILDNLGRTSRVSPRWWVDHGGIEGVTEDSKYLHGDVPKPKGYHGPNSLRGVPFGHQRKHHARRHIRRHRTRRNRRHAVRRHNRKHRYSHKHHMKRYIYYY